MKIHKLHAALKKAQGAETAAKTARDSFLSRQEAATGGFSQAKNAYKIARKELKTARKEATLTRIALKRAERSLEKSAVLVEKLARKLTKAQRKAESKGNKSPVGKRSGNADAKAKPAVKSTPKPVKRAARKSRAQIAIQLPTPVGTFPQEQAAPA